MRAREFTINVPIKITINGDNDPEVSTSSDESDLQQNPVMVSPQQQELELKKAELGKSSPVINKITQDSNIGQEPISEEKKFKEEDEILSKNNFLNRKLREAQINKFIKKHAYTKNKIR